MIRTQENLNVMRKLLFDFKKKIQDSYFYYFYHIGSQKLCERHLATIGKWQEMLENPNSHKRVKRLISSNSLTSSVNLNMTTNDDERHNYEDKENNAGFEKIPFDCKLEIIRRLNTGLDLVNLAKCNRSLNDIISKELIIWKNLCQFHFQQAHINSLVTMRPRAGDESQQLQQQQQQQQNDLDWKQMYFKLKRRYGHREVYVDMVHKCYYCKCLFWKEIGHPCIIAASLNSFTCNRSKDSPFDIRTEPITPKKLIDLLLR